MMDQQGSESSGVFTEVLKLTKPAKERSQGLSIRLLIDFFLSDHLFFLFIKQFETGKSIYLRSVYELIQGPRNYFNIIDSLVYLAKGHSKSWTNQLMLALVPDEDAYQKSLIL